MTPRSIALQGVGFSALLVALQGFGPTELPIAGIYGVASTTLPIDLKLAQKLDEDELMLLIITAAIQCGLLDNH